MTKNPKNITNKLNYLMTNAITMDCTRIEINKQR